LSNAPDCQGDKPRRLNVRHLRAEDWLPMLNPEYKDDLVGDLPRSKTLQTTATELWRARTSRLWSTQQSVFVNERKYNHAMSK